jgi:hypothetical protein
MTPSASTRAAAAAGFLAVVGAIVVGSLHPTPDASHRHTRVLRDGGLPAGSRCYTVTARASPQARALFGLDADGGDQYVRVTVAYQPSDSGTGPSLPSGMDPLDDTAVDAPCPDGGAEIEGGMQGDATSPWQCACAVPDAGCLQPDGGPAPTGYTLQPGAFVPGPGCFYKACEEFAGSTSWVSQCDP